MEFILIFLFIMGLIGGINMLSDGNSTGWLCMSPALLILGFVIWSFIQGKNQEEAKQIQIANDKDLFNTALDKYNKAKYYANVPSEAKIVELTKKGTVFGLPAGKVYLWKKENQLLFFPFSPSNSIPIKLSSIPIKNVEYFKISGEVYRETKISGGGGGGTSVKGAIVGSVIAGDTGAIIGSRKKVDSIKSELITHDERKTLFNYFDGDKERRSLYFRSKDYSSFNDLIPEKEFNIVTSIKSSQLIRSQIRIDENKTTTEQIRELAKLKDEGIITEEEFNEKKKILLDKIT